MSDLLVQAFDRLAQAPGGVARLRELILSLAVEGKLVSQDPRDAPVSTLLARIQARRKNLVTEGMIKASKPESPAVNRDVPFVLPPGWEWICAADACLVITDGDHQAPPKADSGVPFLVIGDVREGAVDLGLATRFVAHDYFDGLDWGKKPLLGDLLYTTVGSLGIPVPVVQQQAFCFQRHIALLRPGLPELQPFLTLVLQSRFAFNQAERGATGIAQKTVPLSVLRRLRLPLPPLAEQARIVTRVDELMRLCDALEAKGRLEAEQHTRLLGTLLGTLTDSATPEELAANWQRVAEHFDLLLDRPEAVDALEQTVLQLAVRGLLVLQDPSDEPASVLLRKIHAEKNRLIAEGKIKRDKPGPSIADNDDSIDLPQGWSSSYVGDVVDMLNGYAFKSEWFKPAGTRLLRNVNIAHGHVDWNTPAYVDAALAKEYGQFALDEGDLVLTLDRPIISSGLKFAVIGERDLPCLLLQRVARLSPDPRVLSRDFLVLWMLSDAFIGALDPGRSNGVPHISTKQVASMPFRLPPIAEQARIVARVTELRRLCADLRQRLATSQATQSRLAEALVESVASVASV